MPDSNTSTNIDSGNNGNTSDFLQKHLTTFLSSRHPPKTFCPSEVARALSPDELHRLGCREWRDAMPLVRDLVWDRKATGACEVLQKGEPVADGLGPEEVKGPIRVRRT